MSAGKVLFAGVGDRDVYNIAAPFELNGKRILAGRVERRDTEHAEIHFFEESRGAWSPVPGAPVLRHLQDPCFTFINGELVVGGVRYPLESVGGATWRMDFYRGKTLDTLLPFFQGPDKMKDIRMKQLADGRILVLTRPLGKKGGRGTIGWLVAESLEEITVQATEEAPLFTHHFIPEEWGGANEAHVLRNGKVGVLGHIACFDARGNRHYYAMTFCFDPATETATDIKLIACRGDFPPGEAKRPDLTDVLFSGGLVRNGDGTATLYAGLSDAEAGWAILPDPFAAYEKDSVQYAREGK